MRRFPPRPRGALRPATSLSGPGRARRTVPPEYRPWPTVCCPSPSLGPVPEFSEGTVRTGLVAVGTLGGDRRRRPVTRNAVAPEPVRGCAGRRSRAPRPTSAGLRPAGPGDGPSSPVRRSRTPSKATARDACCGRARAARGACATRPRCAPRHRRAAPTPAEDDSRGRQPRPTRATGPGQRVPRPGQHPAKEAKDNAPPGEQYTWRQTPRRQPSKRTCIEHINAELRHWHPLQRYPGPRENYTETHQAITSLTSDHSARRPTRHKPNAESALAWQTAC